MLRATQLAEINIQPSIQTQSKKIIGEIPLMVSGTQRLNKS